MATLKKKEVVEETAVEETTEEAALTEDEKEVLTEDGEEFIEETAKVSSTKMTAVLDLLQDTYNLRGKNFELVGYADKSNKIVATLANRDFEIQFTIKSPDILMRLELNK